MTSFRIRPRFKMLSDRPAQDIQQSIQTALERPDATCIGHMIPGHITLFIPFEDRHYWSPQLSLSIEEDQDGTVIRGLYGPNPTVWAMFAFGYSFLGFVSLFVCIVGFSRMNLGLEAPVLWLLPFLAAGFVALYFVAQMGQKIGAEQTFTLHHFFEASMNEKVHVH